MLSLSSALIFDSCLSYAKTWCCGLQGGYLYCLGIIKGGDSDYNTIGREYLFIKNYAYYKTYFNWWSCIFVFFYRIWNFDFVYCFPYNKETIIKLYFFLKFPVTCSLVVIFFLIMNSQVDKKQRSARVIFANFLFFGEQDYII